MENYLLNKDKYLGTPGYPTEEGFAAMEKILPMNHELMQRASEDSGTEDRFRHGRGRRVRTGATPRSSSIACATAEWTQWRRWSRPTHLARKRLGMADQIGSIAPGSASGHHRARW